MSFRPKQSEAEKSQNYFVISTEAEKFKQYHIVKTTKQKAHLREVEYANAKEKKINKIHCTMHRVIAVHYNCNIKRSAPIQHRR